MCCCGFRECCWVESACESLEVSWDVLYAESVDVTYRAGRGVDVFSMHLEASCMPFGVSASCKLLHHSMVSQQPMRFPPAPLPPPSPTPTRSCRLQGVCVQRTKVTRPVACPIECAHAVGSGQQRLADGWLQVPILVCGSDRQTGQWLGLVVLSVGTENAARLPGFRIDGMCQWSRRYAHGAACMSICTETLGRWRPAEGMVVCCPSKAQLASQLGDRGQSPSLARVEVQWMQCSVTVAHTSARVILTIRK